MSHCLAGRARGRLLDTMNTNLNAVKHLLALAAVLVGVSAANADTVTLDPTVDLYVMYDGTKHDDDGLEIGRRSTSSPFGDARALLIFDLSSIPAGSTIDSATLTLNQIDLGQYDNYGNAQLRRIGTSWDGTEAGSVLHGIVSDGSSALIANFSPSVNPPPGLYPLNVTPVVADWVEGALLNYGFGLKQSSEGFTNTARRFDSSDAAGNQPTLTINFTPPGGTALVIR